MRWYTTSGPVENWGAEAARAKKNHVTDGIWTQDLPMCSLKRLTAMLRGPVSLPTLVVFPLWLFPFIKKELYCFMVVYCLWLKANCTDNCDVSFWQWYFWFQVITVWVFFQKTMDMLRQAWDAEGSPFRGRPFDPSAISVDPSGVINMK